MNSNMLNMALQLSMQDMFSGSWFSSALMNRVWTEMLRSSVTGIIRNTGGADLLGAALGGSLRGDAAMLRQASSNVSEAQTMMNMAANAAGSIASQLKEAQTLADDFFTATQGMIPTDPDYAPIYDRFQAQYKALSKNIDSIIKNTMYNGIALLDGSAWASDERLSVIGGAGNPAASVHIQAGDSGFPLTFHNMTPEFFNIAQHALTNPPNPADPPGTPGLPRQDVLTELSSLQSSAQTLADVYAGRAGSLQNQAMSLQSQAKILEEAAAQRSKTPAPVSAENLLLNLILRDSGGLFSGKG
jgi:flagellin